MLSETENVICRRAIKIQRKYDEVFVWWWRQTTALCAESTSKLFRTPHRIVILGKTVRQRPIVSCEFDVMCHVFQHFIVASTSSSFPSPRLFLLRPFWHFFGCFSCSANYSITKMLQYRRESTVFCSKYVLIASASAFDLAEDLSISMISCNENHFFFCLWWHSAVCVCVTRAMLASSSVAFTSFCGSDEEQTFRNVWNGEMRFDCA